MALSSRTVRLLVGTYTEKVDYAPNANGGGIYLFNLTFTDDGQLRINDPSAVQLTNPSYVAITQNKKYLYAITEVPTSQGVIHGFELSKTGPVIGEKIGSWYVGGNGPCHVIVDAEDRFVFVSNYFGGSISAFKICQDTGGLKKSNFHQFTDFSNVNKERQEAPHLHCAIVDAKMRFVYVADLGNDCIWRFDYSKTTGFDNGSIRKFPSPTGSGPRHMVFQPGTDRYLYVSCELNNHLLVYEVGDDGSLEQVQYTPTTADTSGGVSDIHVSPDGKFVYVATRFVDVITVFQVQPDGEVTKVQEIESGGEVPRHFLLYPPLKLALVGNQNSHQVTAFRITKTGELSKMQSFTVNTPAFLMILD